MKRTICTNMFSCLTFLAFALGSASTMAAVTGKVLETFPGGSYSYIRLQTSEGEKWAAVSAAKIKVGESATVVGETEMRQFKSKTLNRTFDRILFGQLEGSGSGKALAGVPGQLPAGHPPMGAGAEKPSVDLAKIDVPKAEGADGYTVAGIHAGQKTLKNKKVVVQGVVVKMNGGIMDRNWLHLRDKTGSDATKDNDLLVTTKNNAKVGDKVRIQGVVHTDKDFGAGYKYSVLVEDAKVEALK